MASLKMVIACDHAGRDLKKTILAHLAGRGIAAADLGVADDVERADYPDLAHPLAKAVAAGEYDLGILVCGTGIGMAMAANRTPGARAANCANEFMARMSRAHNKANILTLGERVVGPGLALAMVDAFIDTPFEGGGRHQARVDKI